LRGKRNILFHAEGKRWRVAFSILDLVSTVQMWRWVNVSVDPRIRNSGGAVDMAAVSPSTRADGCCRRWKNLREAPPGDPHREREVPFF
jgi:hypothetical protein